MSIATTEGFPTGVPTDTLPLRLAIARFAAGRLSAEGAAKLVDVSGQAWRYWEAGTHAPDSATLAYIARRLGVDEKWLREGGPLNEGTGKPGGGERARQDLNLRPADYTDSLLPQRIPGVLGRFRDRRAHPRVRPLLPPIEADDYPRAA